MNYTKLVLISYVTMTLPSSASAQRRPGAESVLDKSLATTAPPEVSPVTAKPATTPDNEMKPATTPDNKMAPAATPEVSVDEETSTVVPSKVEDTSDSKITHHGVMSSLVLVGLVMSLYA